MIFLSLLLAVVPLAGEVKTESSTVSALMGEKKYRDALTIVTRKLAEIYSQRVEDKRIPTEFISLKNTTEDVDLKKLFRERMAKGFFIEENREISLLHKQAGECYLNLKDNTRAVQHLVQSLRFKKIEPFKDDEIYYFMSQAFLKESKITAYHHYLETAWALNQENYNYSRELGTALSRTVKKRKAIFHLSRYIVSKGSSVEPKMLLLLAGLYEDTGRFLQSIDYYRGYLEKKPENGAIHFALGVLSMKRTGNFTLARESLLKALRFLSEKDIVSRSRSHEYLGDMALHNRKFKEAVKQYLATISYQDKVKKKLEEMEKEVKALSEKINKIKGDLLRTQNYDKFEEYELYRGEKGKLEVDLRVQRLKYEKLNNGRVRWNTAYAYERLENLAKAIGYYRAAITFNYRTNDAREKIIKLKLKIKRGY